MKSRGAKQLLNEQERERVQAGHELVSMQHRAKRNQRDIVDMIYDDGLTPKAALALDRQYRLELAREFREAVDALQKVLLHETTCNWCGVDVQTINDHRIVDGQPMCLPCVKEYDLNEGVDYER